MAEIRTKQQTFTDLELVYGTKEVTNLRKQGYDIVVTDDFGEFVIKRYPSIQ